MAFFFPPPPVFTGGAQPYGQTHLTPASVTTPSDNPPFGGRALAASAIASWQPPPPMPMLGELSAWQPGASVDNPPWERFAPVIYVVADTTLPIVQRPVFNAGATLASDNPPFSMRYTWLDSIVASWQPPPPLPTLNNKPFTLGFAATVDNPPFSARHTWLDPIIVAWLQYPPVPLPSLNTKSTPPSFKTFALSPSSSPTTGVKNITATGLATTWTGANPFSVTGGSGSATIGNYVNISPTSATFDLTVTALGTIIITDSNSGMTFTFQAGKIGGLGLRVRFRLGYGGF